jgi:hypothetical protein
LGLDVFGGDPAAPFAVPGKVPHGAPLDGEVPGVVALGELDPGALVFGVPLGDVDPGAVCPACGVVVPVGGGVGLLVGGFTGEPGVVEPDVGELGVVELCPALLEPPAGAAPPGAAWATAQEEQHNTTDSSVSFRDDIVQDLPRILN